jgi:hypothetical protein
VQNLRCVGPALSVVLVLALGFTASVGAMKTPGGHTASACSDEFVHNAAGGETYWGFALRGSVSCSEGHSLIRDYFRRATAGGCRGLGTACGIGLPGGWRCALAGYSGPRIEASCDRGSASVGVFVASPPASYRVTMHLTLFASPGESTVCSASGFAQGEVLCSSGQTGRETAGHYSSLQSNGTLSLCNKSSCLGLSAPHVSVLSDGQRTEIKGILCVSETAGITCTLASGAAAGKGFRINSGEAVEVG